MLKLIGFWRLHESVYEDYAAQSFKWGTEPPDYPHPDSLVDHDWPLEARKRIAAYLNAGKTFEQYRGYSYCRFNCHKTDDENLGSRDYTDGVWVWPEGLGHYVDVHSVRLPEEFLAHVAGNHFRVPETFDTNETKVDQEFWIKWAKAQTTK